MTKPTPTLLRSGERYVATGGPIGDSGRDDWFEVTVRALEGKAVAVTIERDGAAVVVRIIGAHPIGAI